MFKRNLSRSKIHLWVFSYEKNLRCCLCVLSVCGRLARSSLHHCSIMHGDSPGDNSFYVQILYPWIIYEFLWGPNRSKQSRSSSSKLAIFQMIPSVRLLIGFHTSRDLVAHPFVNNPCFIKAVTEGESRMSTLCVLMQWFKNWRKNIQNWSRDRRRRVPYWRADNRYLRIIGDQARREQPAFSHFLWYPRRKCKVEENAILGLPRAEVVRNTCFHIKYSLSHLMVLSLQVLDVLD